MSDRVSLPGASEMGALDRRYDVRIGQRVQELEALISALEARVAALEP